MKINNQIIGVIMILTAIPLGLLFAWLLKDFMGCSFQTIIMTAVFQTLIQICVGIGFTTPDQDFNKHK